ncbi:hypothetical protein LEP1GSC172_0710 [Leptospira noguchii]|uniref:Uncharacterized protein n=2 Tax=Leptospira noguchii TaxID=28182 RepID=T0FBJ5_9LEPT|nr:hypothetical protein LEP1GSC172_0710 [Leptospira noguchii]EQA70538.1 hypothetical protein LEP1GSC059_4618 [Leptospira noguchii serovar Panama str. CZ214]
MNLDSSFIFSYNMDRTKNRSYKSGILFCMSRFLTDENTLIRI